jgi:hypothetical protein
MYVCFADPAPGGELKKCRKQIPGKSVCGTAEVKSDAISFFHFGLQR